MSDAKSVAHSVITVLEVLVPIASSTLAIIGGQPVEVTNSLSLAKTLLPVADNLIMKIGTTELSLDTSSIKTASDVKNILTEAEAVVFPELNFTKE